MEENTPRAVMDFTVDFTTVPCFKWCDDIKHNGWPRIPELERLHDGIAWEVEDSLGDL